MAKRKNRKKRADQGGQTFSFQRFAESSRQQREYVARGGLYVPRQDTAPHYHIMYNAVPHYGEGFETQTMGFRAMAAIRDNFEEHQYQCYEDGIILLKGMKVKDRTGTWDIMMQLGECRNPCNNIRRVQLLDEVIDAMNVEGKKHHTQRPVGARYNPSPDALR